jgi:tetratricopeptide (TPR) repeat protein
VKAPFVLFVLLGVSVSRSPAYAAATLTGFALPSRQHASAVTLVDRIAAGLARTLGATLVPRDASPPVGLDEAAFTRAERLYRKVSFDAAAAASDQILDQAARDPERVLDGARLVALLVQRVSVALARGESQRAERLLELLLRYDPDFALTPTEAEPGLERELLAVRQRVGPRPPLAGSNLGEACHTADVLIVARSLLHDIEIARFDHCALVADTVATTTTKDEQVIAALAQPVAIPQPTDLPAAARDRFEVGVGLERIGKEQEAIREFSAGYALSSRPVFLFHIAEAYRAFSDAPHAKEMYRKFLAEAPADARERADAQRALATLDGAAATEPPASAPARDKRAMRIAGPSVLSLGAVIVGLGGAFLGLARSTSIDASRAGSTFDPGDADRLSRYQAAEAACFAIGGAALTAGVVVTAIGYSRRPRAR